MSRLPLKIFRNEYPIFKYVYYFLYMYNFFFFCSSVGEQSGKANRSVARHIPGPTLDQLGTRASTAASEISRAHQLAMERGEKLNMLEERAERMANTAQDFSGTAHQLMLKYKDKKWYQL